MLTMLPTEMCRGSNIRCVQHLWCLANYEALRFSNPIFSLGQTLIARMKDRSANNSGKYISVHLRFEEDMVAFSCSIYDGGGKEKRDMDAARERGWRGKFTKRGKVIHLGAIRINGKCPLTSLEGLLGEVYESIVRLPLPKNIFEKFGLTKSCARDACEDDIIA
ncbi:Protein ESMERALDA 1 [Datura stramonium]|uniref:O-fucosyltransferase family protein n=1 Tax=Datura stramonium TaxID=4076 RepID=A0ABS8VKN0_DATST|nr:Protein ESMERALDA 1 [Datura stramonium]